MSKVKHKEGKKVSPGGNLSSHDLDPDSCRSKIKELESKIAFLELMISSLKYQFKFIADIMRKE
ncbi:hypothetical protein ES707_22747 [subsurface metagenome]